MKKSIYIIKNDINNKVYIGQAINVQKRFREHTYYREDRLSLIDAAIHKYGKQHFWYEILETDIEDYNEKEIFYINKYNSQRPNGYNITIGGDDGLVGLNNPCSIIQEKQILNNIIEDLKTSLTIEEISNKYNISKNIIYKINRGAAYEQNIKYPIRKLKGNKNFSEEQIEEIKYLLKYTYRTYTNIAEQYGVESNIIGRINRGESYKDLNESYPLRKGKAYENTPLSYVEVSEIIEILINTDLSLRKIASLYQVSYPTIQAIKNGSIKLYRREGLEYPLRLNN